KDLGKAFEYYKHAADKNDGGEGYLRQLKAFEYFLKSAETGNDKNRHIQFEEADKCEPQIVKSRNLRKAITDGYGVTSRWIL
ncbi:16598_t:CDS:2, partial [Dentiscutata erythropus]